MQTLTKSSNGCHVGRHMCSSGPISGEHYSQRQDEIRPFQKLSCQSSPSCGTQSHSCERPYKYQSNSSHLQPSSLLSGRDTQTAGVPTIYSTQRNKFICQNAVVYYRIFVGSFTILVVQACWGRFTCCFYFHWSSYK
mgnify:FL=1